MVGTWLITNAKNGVSSCEVARAIGVTQNTAWFVLNRIRALWPPKMAAPTPEQIKLFNSIMLGKRTDDDIKALIAVMRGGMGPAAEISTDALNEKLKSCTIPILGIVGSDDPAKKNLENLQARLKELKGDMTGMTLVVIDMGNHADTPNKPEFVSGITDFLKAHPGAK